MKSLKDLTYHELIEESKALLENFDLCKSKEIVQEFRRRMEENLEKNRESILKVRKIINENKTHKR